MLEESQRRPYYSLVKDRCIKQIDMHIWDGIDKNKFDAWLKNFQSDKEKFFAACILDNLIYRSEIQTISLLYDLLSRDLDNLFRSNNFEINDSPLSLLRNKYKDPGFRIVAALTRKDGASKSGYFMCNLIVHQLDVCEKWTINPDKIDDEIQKGIKCFVLLDDILCSGNHMKETIEDWGLCEKGNVNFTIAVCAAHQVGLNQLNENFNEIKIAYTELLTHEDSFFSSIDCTDFDFQTIDEVKDFYQSFMKSKNIKYENIFGYDGISLLYAFKHNVPNNCLPIIHYESDDFKSLIAKRK